MIIEYIVGPTLRESFLRKLTFFACAMLAFLPCVMIALFGLVSLYYPLQTAVSFAITIRPFYQVLA